MNGNKKPLIIQVKKALGLQSLKSILSDGNLMGLVLVLDFQLYLRDIRFAYISFGVPKKAAMIQILGKN